MAPAPAPATSSPRDHAADANPDLARKKQRISDEEKAASTDDSVIIEALEPEDIGSNIDNAIEIEDDLSVIMAPYSEDFIITAEELSPFDQICRLEHDLAQNNYLHPVRFRRLAGAIDQHLRKTDDESSEWRQHYLEDEGEFFSRLALAAIGLLDSGDLFEPVVDNEDPDMRRAFEGLLIGLEMLSRRIIPFIPEALKTILSRRDSAQTSTRAQSLGCLYYVVVAQRVLSQAATSRFFYKYERNTTLEGILIGNRRRFFEENVVSALVAVIRTLSGGMRGITDSWLILHNALSLYKDVISMYGAADGLDRGVEEVMDIVKVCIQPTICEKHPRALTEGFHSLLVEFGMQALLSYAEEHDLASATALYERFVKSDRDAVIPDSSNNSSTFDSLRQLCGDDLSILARLLKTSWALQATHSFIRSDIMDVRNVGVSLLRHHLVTLFKAESSTVAGSDNPVVQYAVRFLRQNEITAYLFGPESRAGLLHHSADIICFLAATSTYTDAETDIIWRACSTSVEADFVKASFVVLDHLMGFLNFHHLVYIARKYSTTPLEKLDPGALRFLDKLFQALEEKIFSPGASSDRLTLVFTAVEIFKAANNIDGRYPVKEPLRNLCKAEIDRFTDPRIPLDEKAEVYKDCIPEIQKRTEHATTAVEVLTLFLKVKMRASEAEHVLAMLPVSAAVDELCSFVKEKRTQGLALSSINGAMVRLECIARLMDQATDDSDKPSRDRLFDYAFGDSALCNEARNLAWVKLNDLASETNVPSAASALWQGYMQDHVLVLRADLATPKLIEFISASLRADFGRGTLQSDPSQILDLPLWKTLVRFATTSTEPSVINMAVGVILDLLFDYPTLTTIPPFLIVPCQSQFARTHIKSLCLDYEEVLRSKDTADPRKLFQGINLLNAILSKSRETASKYTPAKKPSDLVLCNLNDEAETIKFTAQIYGPDAQPKALVIRARRDTKVSDLTAMLPQETGTAENRVIAAGKELTLDPDRTLSDAGVDHAGVIMIRPKYTFDFNLDEALTCSGTVEQEILDQYDSLECFLDGPEYIAQKMFGFLCNVRQSSLARIRVSSESATAQDLFPQDRPWRSAFSLKVLQRYLQDFAHLGVADTQFIERTIRLIVSVLVDDSRPFQPLVVFEIATTLLKFLEERAHDEDSRPTPDLDPHLVSRMISLLFESLALPIELNQAANVTTMRTSIVIILYQALLTACRTNDGLWNIFTEEPSIVEVHKSVLLDDDRVLSSRISQYIKGLCLDRTMSGDVANFYWQAIIPSLPEALRRGVSSEAYFDLAVDLLNRDVLTQVNETKIRGLIDTLTSELWSYRHRESIQLPVIDKAMGGLLRLLGVAVTVLKKLKKPLQLGGLSSRLLRQLLLPSLGEEERHPLITAETRNYVYDIVRWSFEPDADYDNAISIACEATHQPLRIVDGVYPGDSDWFRAPWNAAGLSNLGMTCYMNSLLQQLFFNLQFRKFILEQRIPELQQRDALAQVQLLFAKMQDSTQTMADTTSLAQSLNVQIGNQEDVHTFYTALLSRLEECLLDSETKIALARFFTGKSITQVKGECGHISSRTEPFTELSVTVKNKGSLAESLDEFVQGEPLEGANKYMCMTCAEHDGGRLVNAMRRTCLEDVPDNLTFCLKRFTYESMMESENKVNDRFDFPSAIDMSLYKRSYLEDPSAPRGPDEFELVGVIVHQGSLQYGHYWSYVRVPGANNAESGVWMCLEDSRFFRCANGIQDVQEQCFGGPRTVNGNERSDNAYVLFYQRKSYIAEAKEMSVVPNHLRFQCQVLPRVDIPHGLALDIETDNKWRQHIESLFNSQFSAFIIWLLGQSQSVLKARNSEDDDQDKSSVSDEAEGLTNSEIEMKLGDLISNYAMRILLADPTAEARLDSFMTSLISLVEANTATAAHTLTHFCANDAFGFANTVRNESAKVRGRLFDGIWRCMIHLRQQAPQTYDEVYPIVMKSHASVVGLDLDASCGKWDEFLDFANRFAQLGFEETGMILERRYLAWVFEILHLRLDAEIRKGHMALYNWMRINNPDLSGLFNFIFKLLSQHVDLAEEVDNLPRGLHQRFATVDGWCLRREEVEQLTRVKSYNSHEIWTLFLTGTRYCSNPGQIIGWKEYAPGRLFGLLVSEKANLQILRFVEKAMLQHYEFEENDLVSLLLSTLHYCANRPDQDCVKLMVPLGKSLPLWAGCEREILGFYDLATTMAPCAVVESIPGWLQDFFLKKKSSIRQQATSLLHDHVFMPPPLSENPSLDVARIRTTRTLVGQFVHTLSSAYNKEHLRGRYEPMINVLEQAATYLNSLHTAVTQQRQNGVRIGHEILIEHDESRNTLARLMQFLEEIKHWEIETSLPTRPHDVRRSVEVDSEESETSYAEMDDVSSEQDPA